MPDRHRWTIALLALAICAFTLAFTALSHWRFTAFKNLDPRDEAVNNQILYNTAHGQPLRSTIKGHTIFHRHFRPVFLLLSIPYLIHSGPTTYYFAVALLLALGALAAFMLGVDLFGDRRLGLLCGLAWLLFPPVQELALGMFDPETVAATFWLFAFVYFQRRQIRPFWLFAFLAIICKETHAPILAALGVIALIQRRRWTWSALPIAVGAVWFVVAVKFIIPLYFPNFALVYNRFVGVDSMNFWGDFLHGWATAPGAMLAAIFSREHLHFLLMLLLAGGGLAVLSPLTLLATGPILLEIFLHKDPLPVRQAHIIAGIAPFVFAATLLGVARLAQWVKKKRIVKSKSAVPAALLVGLLILGLVMPWLSGPFGRGRTYGVEDYLPTSLFDGRWFDQSARDRRAWQMIGKIGADAPAMANERYLLAMSTRPVLYEFGNQGDDLDAYNSVDWILLGLTEPRCPTCTYALLTPESLAMAVRLIQSGRFAVADAAEHVILLRRRSVAGPEVAPETRAEVIAALVAMARQKERERNAE